MGADGSTPPLVAVVADVVSYCSCSSGVPRVRMESFDVHVDGHLCKSPWSLLPVIVCLSGNVSDMPLTCTFARLPGDRGWGWEEGATGEVQVQHLGMLAAGGFADFERDDTLAS